MSDLRLLHTPPQRQRGSWVTTIKVYADDMILYAETVRLDDPAERAAFAEQVRARRNGNAPDAGVIEQKLLAILDEATTAEADRAHDEGEKQSQATRLVGLALDAAELFCDELEEPYARLAIDGHFEVWPTRSKRFKTWLAGRFYARFEKAVGSQAIADALLVIDAEARFHGPCRPVYLRVAPDGLGGLYLDLADDRWRAVHVTPAGWQIVERPPVYFHRSAGMLPLPEPARGGRLDDLRALVNVPDDDDWALVKAWLRAVPWPGGPYPILVLKGEHGTGKTTLAEMLRRLVDPADPLLRSNPRERRDLMIAARGNWIVALDNVAHVEPWLAVDLCRLSTGAGWATRELYTDTDEAIFRAKRPVLLNGISEFIAQTDLSDRVIQVVLPAIADDDRREERALWAAFDAAWPRLLGALLDDVAGALRAQAGVKLKALPRMADFAVWAVAAERGAGEAARFLAAYQADRAAGQLSAIEDSLVGRALEQHLVPTLDAGAWQGTAGELLAFLNESVPEKQQQDKRWPKTPNKLAGELRNLAPAFRLIGVVITFGRRQPRTGKRLITIARDKPGGTSSPSSPSSPPEFDRENQGETDREGVTIAAGGDDVAVTPPIDRHPDFPGNIKDGDDGDDGDDGAGAFSKALVFSVSTPLGPRAVRLITMAADLADALPALRAAPVVGLDCETTGLDPHADRLRLIQLATADGVYVVDGFRVDPRPLAPLFAGDDGPTIVGHHLKFDLRFLARAGLPAPNGRRLFDTLLASQLLGAGTDAGRLDRCSLAAVAARVLGITLDKTLQTSDWRGPLTDDQIAYAATDAAVLLPLYERLAAMLQDAGLAKVARIEFGALPAVAWLEDAGAPFDAARWQQLSDAAVRRQIELEAELARLAGAVDLLGHSTVNWSSPEQVVAVLRQRGHAVERTDEATLLALADRDPIARLLLEYREATKRAGTYGIAWLRHVRTDGRIHPDYVQIGAATGRMACHRPNLQQIPRDPAYRACFRAPEGRVLVKADYAQIELRIAAEIAGDRAMIAAFQRGEDLHALTARSTLGKSEVTKADRQAAKALNFGLIYGMGAARFCEHAAREYGVQFSVEEAEALRDRFFATYPGIRRWHRAQPRGPMTTKTLLGRTRLGVEKFTEKLNTPVQGSGADGLKLALALLWETRDRCPSAVPVLAVHDEIVVECDATEAEAARQWLVECMTRGMQAVLREVPVVVEAQVVRDWSGSDAGG